MGTPCRTAFVATARLDRSQVQERNGNPAWARTLLEATSRPGNSGHPTLFDWCKGPGGKLRAALRAAKKVCTANGPAPYSATVEGLFVQNGHAALIQSRGRLIYRDQWPGSVSCSPNLRTWITPVRGASARLCTYCADIFPQPCSAAITPTGEYWQQAGSGWHQLSWEGAVQSRTLVAIVGFRSETNPRWRYKWPWSRSCPSTLSRASWV